MRLECSNKGHRDSNSCIASAHSYLRILERDALLRRLSIWIFSRHKKATNVIYDISGFRMVTFVRSDKRGLDGHDSQEIPEENRNHWVRYSGLAFL